MSTVKTVTANRPSPVRGGGPSRPPPPAWLDRLWQQQRVPLSRERLYWWGVHVQSFLAFVRRHQLQGPVDVLAAQFLDDLRVAQPPIPDWRRDQARQALHVFGRGIEVSGRGAAGVEGTGGPDRGQAPPGRAATRRPRRCPRGWPR